MRISIITLILMALAIFAGTTNAVAEVEYLTAAYRGGVSIEGCEGGSSHIVVPSSLGGKPVLKVSDWVFKGNDIRTVTFPATLQELSARAFYGCRNLANITFSGKLPEGRGDFTGLSGTLPTVQVWPGCGGEGLGGMYRGLQLDILPGSTPPAAERVDQRDGHLFEQELRLCFPNSADGLVLRYALGYREPTPDSATIAGGATLTLTASTRLALRWFTADGQPASGTRYQAYGSLAAAIPPAEDFKLRACYCQGPQGRLEIEGYHGLEPVVRIPTELDGKPVYNLCSSGQWSTDCLAVLIPPGMASCGYHFDSCQELEYLAFPHGLRRLTNGTARNCRQLRQVLLPDTLQEIGTEAFAGCELLDGLKLPPGLVSIESAAFQGCRALQTLSFPASLAKIGTGAFLDCPDLTTVTFFGPPPARHSPAPVFDPGTLQQICVLPGLGWANTYDGIPVIILNDRVPVITGQDNGNSDFFSDTLTVALGIVGGGAPGGNEIRYTLDASSPEGDSPLYAEPFAIQGTTVVTARVFSQGQSLGPAVTRTFVRKDTDQSLGLFYPDAETGFWQYRGREPILALPTLAAARFSGLGCNPDRGGTLGALYVPATVLSLNGNTDSTGPKAHNPFRGQRLLRMIDVNPDNLNYCVIDGVLFDKSGTTLLAYPPAREGDFYAVPDGVQWIAAGAFAWAANLTEIDFPDTIATIGEGAFQGMTSLQHIQFPAGIDILSPFLLQGCTALNQLTLPFRLQGISRHALAGCSNLARLELPPFLKHIGSSAFRGCSSLETITIPAGLNSLAVSAFFECREGLVITFTGDINYSTFIYGDPEAGNPDTGEYLLRPLTIRYWEYFDEWGWPQLWPERFIQAIYGRNDDLPDLSNLVTLQQAGIYPCGAPRLEFKFQEDENPSAQIPVEILLSGEAADQPNAAIYYTLDGSEPHPDNPEVNILEFWNIDWIPIGNPLPLTLRVRIFDSVTEDVLSQEQWLCVSWADKPATYMNIFWDSEEDQLSVMQFAGLQLKTTRSWNNLTDDPEICKLPAEYAAIDLPEYWNYFDYSDLKSKSETGEIKTGVFFVLPDHENFPDEGMPVELSRNFCSLPVDWSNDGHSVLQQESLWHVQRKSSEFRLEALDDSGQYRVDNGVLYWQNTLLFYPGAKQGNSYIILGGTTRIMEEAFLDNNFFSWEYPGDWVEDEETGEWNYVLEPPPLGWVDHTLRSVTVPGSVTLVEDRAFAECWHLQTARFLGPPPEFGSDEIFPAPADWWSKPVNCVVLAFPGCGWEKQYNRWQDRIQNLRGDMTDPEWQEHCSWSDDWTFYGAVDLQIAGFMPPVITLNQDGTASIRCDDLQGQEAPPETIVVYYTIDGSTPDAGSTPYAGPFQVPAECQNIHAVAYYRDGSGQASAMGTTEVTVVLQPGDPDAVWQPVQLTTPAGGAVWQTPDNDALENRHSQTFAGAGSLSFWWKMDASAGTYTLQHNGKIILSRRSYLPWELVELSVSGAGIHTFTWTFSPGPDTAQPSPDTAWLGGITWRNATAGVPQYRRLTVYNGAISGQYRVGQTVEVLADILDIATFSRWNIISGLAGALQGNSFVMPDNDVILQAVYRVSHCYSLSPGWNLLGSYWETLEGDNLENTWIYVHDPAKLTYVRQRLAELSGLQSFWIFNAGDTAQELELSGEISDQEALAGRGWVMQPGTAVEEATESYRFAPDKQQFQKLPAEEEQDPWLGYWQYLPE